MTFQPEGDYITPYKMRIMLAENTAMQSVMLPNQTGTPEERKQGALSKIWTYGPEPNPEDADAIQATSYPRCLIHDSDVVQRTGDMGEILDVVERVLKVWAGFYVPDQEDIQDNQDEHAWCLQQFSAINRANLAMAGRGEVMPGHSHLMISNPRFMGCEKLPHDARGDRETDKFKDLSLWIGVIQYEVR